jgi:hypothetical protein
MSILTAADAKQTHRADSRLRGRSLRPTRHGDRGGDCGAIDVISHLTPGQSNSVKYASRGRGGGLQDGDSTVGREWLISYSSKATIWQQAGYITLSEPSLCSLNTHLRATVTRNPTAVII